MAWAGPPSLPHRLSLSVDPVGDLCTSNHGSRVSAVSTRIGFIASELVDIDTLPVIVPLRHKQQKNPLPINTIPLNAATIVNETSLRT